MTIHRIQIIAQIMNNIINIWYIKAHEKSALNDADIISQQLNEQSSNMLIIKVIVDWFLPRCSCLICIGENH